MVKTIKTYIENTHKDAFLNFLKSSHRLEQFTLIEDRNSNHLSIQFYDKGESDYFSHLNLDAKFLIKIHTDEDASDEIDL